MKEMTSDVVISFSLLFIYFFSNLILIFSLSLQPLSSVHMVSPSPFTPACSVVRSSNHEASWNATPRITTRMFWPGKSTNAQTVILPPTRKPASTITWRCMLWAARPLSSVKCVARSSTSRRHYFLTDCSTTTGSPRASHLHLPPRCINASFVTMKLLSKGCSIDTYWQFTAKASPTSVWNVAKAFDILRS